MNVAARVKIVNRKDEIVGKILEGPTVEAVQKKIDRLSEAGTLVSVDGWADADTGRAQIL